MQKKIRAICLCGTALFASSAFADRESERGALAKPVKVIASIEDPAVIKKILDHLKRRAEPATPVFRSFARAPPQMALPGIKEPG